MGMSISGMIDLARAEVCCQIAALGSPATIPAAGLILAGESTPEQISTGDGNVAQSAPS